MKKYFIENLDEYLGKEITDFFAISEKSLRTSKAGKSYLRLTCVDKSGVITGNIWENAGKVAKNFTTSNIAKIRATVEFYEGQLQLNISNIRRAKAEEYNLTDFYPTTEKDLDLFITQLFEFIDSVSNTYLNDLLHSIFDDKEFLKKFTSAPAAKNWHHNILGGLLHHTINVTIICNHVSGLYESINRDLLITAAILHDIGKVKEYHWDPFIDFTDQGKLIGHIVLGDELVSEKCKKIDNFPPKLMIMLRHLLLSHHGEMEKGAATLPKTREALLLHYADSLDAHLVGAQELIEDAKKLDKKWTDFDNLTKRKYYTEDES
ncbi:MAG: 3'-5' exoribonuclease YhaM family protein [Candidatus Cloacimonadia bacterium]